MGEDSVGDIERLYDDFGGVAITQSRAITIITKDKLKALYIGPHVGLASVFIQETAELQQIRLLTALSARGGNLLQRVHRRGWTPPDWEFVASHEKPEVRWVAFLLTDTRSVHANEFAGDNHMEIVDDFVGVSRRACLELLSVDPPPHLRRSPPEVLL